MIYCDEAYSYFLDADASGTGSHSVETITRFDKLVDLGALSVFNLSLDADILGDGQIGQNDSFSWNIARHSTIRWIDVYGDAFDMNGGIGGNDKIRISSKFDNVNSLDVYGDSYSMRAASVGGDDHIDIKLSDAGVLDIAGDAFDAYDNARGGDDHIIVEGENLTVVVLGDTYYMVGNIIGGDDLIQFADTARLTFAFGDAEYVEGNITGGDDSIIGGAEVKSAYFSGDFRAITTRADNVVTMGDDHIVANGAETSSLVGDTRIIYEHGPAVLIFGDDVLVSGTGNDRMYGDYVFSRVYGDVPATYLTGADTFVFERGSGHDTIEDFRHSDGDQIDVSAYGYDSMDDMQMSGDTITFDDGSTVTLTGLDASLLVADDFIFA